MVVEDRGHAVAQAVQHGGVGARAGAVKREVVVDLPPLLLEVLEEVGGVAALDGQAAGQAGVDVGVAVHQARHDDAAVGVHDLGVRVLLGQRGGGPDLGDLLAIDGDGAVLEVGVVSVARDDATVGDEQHGSSFYLARRTLFSARCVWSGTGRAGGARDPRPLVTPCLRA